MAGVNKVILVGHLGKDPEVRTLDNGVKVAKFSVATSESYKDKNSGEKIENTEWHNVSVWRGLADVAENYLKKGSLVYLEGKLQTRTYEQDGITKYATDIVARELTMLGRKADNPGNNDSQSINNHNTPSQGKAVPTPFESADDDDELPF